MPFSHPLLPKILTSLRGYSLSAFRRDFLAGVTVGMISLPVAMACAVAAGLEPVRGLYTSIVAGCLISLLGGSHVQIGGPTGAFIVVVYATLERHGYDGLVAATVLAAALLMLMGAFRLGRLIRYIPHPLIVGFTTGLGVLIFTGQLKDLLGLPLTHTPPDFLDKWECLLQAIPHLDPTAMIIGISTLTSVFILRRYFPALPWGITAMGAGTFLAWILPTDISTIGSRFGSLPASLPSPILPQLYWDWAWIKNIFPDALAIALLAGIESLSSALIADRMTGQQHKPDCELIGMGIANAASVCFGGIPATGAIARTAANVKAGACTPIAGIIHAVFLCATLCFCGALVEHIPLTVLAAILCVVAWNIAELPRFFHLFRAPKEDIIIMLCAFFLTVFVDLTSAVQGAMIVALFLFMKTMSDRGVLLRKSPSPEHTNIEVCEIQGPLFFGIADKIHELQTHVNTFPKILVLCMEKVAHIDASGMHALAQLFRRCEDRQTTVVVAGLSPDAVTAMQKFGTTSTPDRSTYFFSDLAAGMECATQLLLKMDNSLIRTTSQTVEAQNRIEPSPSSMET